MPSTLIPLTFRAAPLPDDFVGSPQDFADALVARLSAVSSTPISFFASGSVAPTSNVGPWLKNDQTWYVWSDSLATYIPEIIEPQSLGYTFSQTTPDPVVFKIWFRLDGSNNPSGISIYANGSWQDVYAAQFANYSTTTQMNTAIAAALGAQNKYAFSAGCNAAQIFAANSGPIDVVYDSESYDFGNAYDPVTYKFTAPVSGVYRLSAGLFLGKATGTPTDYFIGLLIVKDGPQTIALLATNEETNLNGRSRSVSREVFLTAGQSAWVQLDVISSGASTWGNDSNSAMNYFQGFLVQAS